MTMATDVVPVGDTIRYRRWDADRTGRVVGHCYEDGRFIGYDVVEDALPGRLRPPNSPLLVTRDMLI